MNDLNYHHLQYFHAVAHEGHLTRAAERLNLSQSALSSQIKALEGRLGHALFERKGRRLHLTEVGKIALDYADQIFSTGNELLATLAREGAAQKPLRVGALSTLSRNFQLQFLRPLFDTGTEFVLRSGNARRLLGELQSLSLDVVLITEAPGQDAPELVAHRLSEQPVALHGRPERLQHKTLCDLLASEPVIVPTESSIRTGFDALTARLGIRPQIVADVDDMAMVRLLTREGLGVAIAPSVVFADELASGRLLAAEFALDIVESFYAITVPRNFPHPALDQVLFGRDNS